MTVAPHIRELIEGVIARKGGTAVQIDRLWFHRDMLFDTTGDLGRFYSVYRVRARSIHGQATTGVYAYTPDNRTPLGAGIRRRTQTGWVDAG